MQNVVSGLNNERTRLIEMKPVDAIKQTLVNKDFLNPLKITKKNYLMLVPRLDIFMNLVSWKDSNMEVNEEKDLLILYGQ